MKNTISPFISRQYMKGSSYELYHYSNHSTLGILPHVHDHYELYYFLGGQVDYVIGNQIYSLQKGDFLLLPPGLLHYPNRLNGTGIYERIILWFSIDFFEQLVLLDPDLNYIWDAVKRKNSYHIRPAASTSQTISNLLFGALEENNEITFSGKMQMFVLIGMILVHINRALYHMEHFQLHTPVSDLYNNVLYYIHTHLSEELSLELLSKEFFVSKGYISKIFREHLDISVHKYILYLRLEGSINAILTGIPITKAAETFGFKDYAGFFRIFKQVYSISPKEFKEKMLNGQESE